MLQSVNFSGLCNNSEQTGKGGAFPSKCFLYCRCSRKTFLSISCSVILLLPQLPLTSFQSYSIKLPFWEFRTIAPGIRTKHIRCYTALTHNNHHNHHIASNPISVAQVFITFLCLGFHRETVLSQIRFLFSYKINLIHIVFAFAFFFAFVRVLSDFLIR